MATDRDAELFARMPPGAADSLRAIATAPTKSEVMRRSAEALALVGYPLRDQMIPLPVDLTEGQRAAAEWLAERRGVGLTQYAIPINGWCRKRWLGLAPGGLLERPIDFEDTPC